MNISNNKEKHWYAARTKRNQEMTIKTSLQRLNIEHFAPFRTEIRQRKDRKVKIKLPIIPNIIFIRTDYEASLLLRNDYGLPISYIKALGEPGHLIVPDKQIEDFMALCNANTEFSLTNTLKRGDRVRITSGCLSGIEGEVITEYSTKRLIIRVEGIAAFDVEIPANILTKI